MEIVVCTDRNYIMPCGILFYSLCKNNKSCTIVFHVVIDASVTDEDKSSLTSIAGQFNQQIEFHLIDSHLFDTFPNLGPNVYVSKATYYRLYLTEILPSTIDKILYLDCDMVIRKDLNDLWNKDIANYAVGVSADGWESKIQIFNRLEYPYEKGYFNAGMLLINLKYWREHNVLGRCLNFIKNHFDRIVSHDQDVLNFVLQDEKVPVGITYNFLENFLYKKNLALFDYSKYKDEIDKAKNDPAIIHYVASKPWMTNCTNPYKDVYLKYKKETQWKDMPIQSPKKTIRSRIKKLFQLLGIMGVEINMIDEKTVSELKIR